MQAIQRKRLPYRNGEIVVYNDNLELHVQNDGPCWFEYHDEDRGRLEYSVNYESEQDADDAYCGREIEWPKDMPEPKPVPSMSPALRCNSGFRFGI